MSSDPIDWQKVWENDRQRVAEAWQSSTDPQELDRLLQLIPRARGRALTGTEMDRKVRLFLCAACRRLWRWLTRPQYREAVVLIEHYADGLADREQLRQALTTLRKARSMAPVHTMWEQALSLAISAGMDAPNFYGANMAFDRSTPEGRQAECELFREIFGNPFQPATLDPAWLTWGDGCVVRVAQGIYDERRFTELPVLADALEDAGCDNPDLLAHCRSSVDHVRGCWLLDLLLRRDA